MFKQVTAMIRGLQILALVAGALGQTPAMNMSSIPSGATLPQTSSLVVIVTTSTSVLTSSILPTTPPQFVSQPYPPWPSTRTQAQVSSVVPVPMEQAESRANFSAPMNIAISRMLVGRNYSSIFDLPLPANLTESASAGFDASCDLSLFCANRSPGIYCYRPPSVCADASNKTALCHPVAMVICPEGVLQGCAEGFACHQEPEPWPWDAPALLEQASKDLGIGRSVLPFFAPPGPEIPMVNFQLNQTSSGNATSTTQMPIAHCRFVLNNLSLADRFIRASLLPTSRPDMQQWCSYRNATSMQQPACGNSLAPPPSKCISTSSSSSINKIWWWPGYETGAEPVLPTATTGMSSGKKDWLSEKCIPSPPTTCQGPYPFAIQPTKSFFFISVSTVTNTTTTTAMGSMSSTVPVTSVITSITTSTTVQTVTSTQLQTDTIRTTVTVPEVFPLPATIAPTTSLPTAAPAVPEPAKTAIPAESFPKAGEPYSVYTAKIGAIASIGV